MRGGVYSGTSPLHPTAQVLREDGYQVDFLLSRLRRAARVRTPSEEHHMGSIVERRDPDTDQGWTAGARAKGEFRCRDCGYGVTVYRSLPTCPMCQGVDWERAPWRPYTRSYAHLASEPD
jgi:rubrerythrin